MNAQRSRASLNAGAVLFVVAGLALTCTLWLAFRPTPTASATKPVASRQDMAIGSRTAGPQPTSSATSSTELTFELVLAKGRLISGPARMEVHEGDIVVVEITSDTRDELHLHGYDLRAQVTPGQPTRLSFRATRTGRFGLELHGAHSELDALEVYPR